MRRPAVGAVLLCSLVFAGCGGAAASPVVAMMSTSGTTADALAATTTISMTTSTHTATQPRPTPSPTATPEATAQTTASTTTLPVSTSMRRVTTNASANLAFAVAACRSDPHAGVYHPQRLIVQRPCVAVTGVVDLVRQEPDGDLLNARNLTGERGDLVAEIVPADQPGCTPGQPRRAPSGSYSYGIYSGLRPATPPAGALVQAIGPYVLDADHGRMGCIPSGR